MRWLFLKTLNPEFVHYIIWEIHKASSINKGALIHPPVSDLFKEYIFHPTAVFFLARTNKVQEWHLVVESEDKHPEAISGM